MAMICFRHIFQPRAGSDIILDHADRGLMCDWIYQTIQGISGLVPGPSATLRSSCNGMVEHSTIQKPGSNIVVTLCRPRVLWLGYFEFVDQSRIIFLGYDFYLEPFIFTIEFTFILSIIVVECFRFLPCQAVPKIIVCDITLPVPLS